MWKRLRGRNEWKFFAVLPQADRRLAFVWWLALLLRGVLPAVFAVAMGMLVSSVQRGETLIGPLIFSGVVFVLLQVLAPLQTAVSQNLGDRTAAWLYDRLARACVRPPGMGHLEDPRLTGDLTVARDFDLGMTGPPLSYGLDFIAGSMVELVGGLAAAVVLFAYAWWAPIVLAGAWLATHWGWRYAAAHRGCSGCAVDEVDGRSSHAGKADEAFAGTAAAVDTGQFCGLHWNRSRALGHHRQELRRRTRITRSRQ